MRKLIFATIFLIISLFVNPNTEGFTRELNKNDIKKLVKKWCLIYKLDESLILSIIDIESSFNPKMENPKSTSKGLGGFLKYTTFWVGNLAGYKNLEHGNVPIEIQIELICVYLDYLSHKYKGNEIKMLKEYSGNTKGYLKAIQKRRVKYK